MQVLDGKQVSQTRRAALKKRISQFQKATGYPPGLAVVLVGEDPASQVYVSGKEKACVEVGLASFRFNKPANTSQEELDR